MSLREKLGEYLPLLGRKPALPRAQSLALRPVRSALVHWERGAPDEETLMPGMVTLKIPLPPGGMAKLLARLFSMPGSKTIELDEFGGQIWEMCDGQHTVERLVVHTCAAYQLNRRQAEVSVLAFLHMLLERRVIGLIEANFKEKQHGSAGHHCAAGRRRGQRTQRARRRN